MASKKSSRQKQSPLAKEQQKILAERQAQFNEFFFPEMVSDIRSTTAQPGGDPALIAGTVGRTNEQFDLAQSRLQNQLAQRGVSGGFVNTALSNLEANRAGTLANVRQQGYLNTLKQRQSLLGLAQGLAPRTTTAAPILTRSKEHGGYAKAFGDVIGGMSGMIKPPP